MAKKILKTIAFILLITPVAIYHLVKGFFNIGAYLFDAMFESEIDTPTIYSLTPKIQEDLVKEEQEFYKGINDDT